MGEHLIGEGDKQLDRLRQDSQKFRQVFDEAMQDAESREQKPDPMAVLEDLKRVQNVLDFLLNRGNGTAATEA